MSKIVVVEDDSTTVKLLTFMLEKEKHEVVSCDNGIKALETIKDIKPDLILMDVMMPGMNGFEVASRIKQDPATSNIKIIILSALGQEMEVMKGLQSGADAYVVKPFDSQSLMRIIDEKLS